MTDTFASGSNSPGGPQPQSQERTGDVTGMLAELERKLRELERELTAIGHRREPISEQPGSAPSTPPPSTPEAPRESPGRLIDEALESPTPAQPAHAAAPPARAPAPPSQPSPPPSPLSPAPDPPSPAPGSSSPPPHSADTEPIAPVERSRPSESQLASLAELRRFRDRLERFAKELTAEYDALLGRVMAGFSAAPNRTGPTAPSGAVAPALSSPASVATRPAAPIGAAPPTAAPPTPAPPFAAPPAPVATSAPASPEDALFEGRVELGVGPFYDIGALGAFERRLASLSGVSEATVRRFEASHAVVDVRLAVPTALLRELRRTADSDFNVREIASGRILLTFDDG